MARSMNIKEIVFNVLCDYNNNKDAFENDFKVLVESYTQNGTLSYYYTEDLHCMDSYFVVSLFDAFMEDVEFFHGRITPQVEDKFNRYAESEHDGMFSQIYVTVDTKNILLGDI